MTHEYIDPQRLTLRPLVPADAAALFEIFSDPRVMQYWNTPPWASIACAQAFIDEDRRARAAGELVRFGIFLKESNVLIGKCMLFDHSPSSRRAEIGFGIAASYWGAGYIQEASAALIEHGFNAMNLNRIEAEIDPQNIGSAKALERMGFSLEGLLRERWIVDGIVSDSAFYGLLRQDWLQARARVEG